MNQHFLVFINPISGTKSKKNIEQIIVQKCRQQSVLCSVVQTNAKANYAIIHENFDCHNYTNIVIVGGDGTVNQIINQFKKYNLPFGIVPIGSGNGLARAAKISMNIEEAINNLFNNKTINVDAFLVNNKFACMLAGIGFDAQVAHSFAKQKSRGFITYFKQTIQHFFIAKPFLFSIETKKHTIQTEAFFISVANSNQFGNNVTIAPYALLNDGLLDVVVVNKTHKLQLLFNVIKQLKGKFKPEDISDINLLKPNAVLYFQAPVTKIINHQNAPLHIDGEPVETNNIVEIKIIENAFQLMV